MKLMLAQFDTQPLSHASHSMKSMLGWAMVFSVVVAFAYLVNWLGKPRPKRRRAPKVSSRPFPSGNPVRDELAQIGS